jgi:hypothetical protein
MMVSRLAYSSTLKMEATYSSETVVDLQQILRVNIQENGTFQTQLIIEEKQTESCRKLLKCIFT